MRKRYIPAEKVLETADLKADDTIMDIGGGDGFYTLLFSEHVKEVIYVDSSEPAISLVKERIGKGDTNIRIMNHDICSLDLPFGVTKVFFSNSFHDIECRDELVKNFVLSSNGRVEFVLVEFKKDADIGPPAYMKLGSNELDKIFSSHDYIPVARVNLEKHYVTRYGKAPS